jgi:SAM-dependent methyltransferase
LIAHQQHHIIESDLPILTPQSHTPIFSAHPRQPAQARRNLAWLRPGIGTGYVREIGLHGSLRRARIREYCRDFGEGLGNRERGGSARRQTHHVVPPYRDVAAFDDRAGHYDRGWRGHLHHEISDRTADLATTTDAAPKRVLDVGCGTGYLIRTLASRYHDAEDLAGIDAAPQMIEVANSLTQDARLKFAVGVAEQLPFPDGAIDLIVSTTSFDHWSDQQAGLSECARVLRPGGHLVLVDQFSWCLLPTVLVSRRDKARIKRRANGLLVRAGFERLDWHNLYAAIIKAVIATKPA